MCLGLDCPAHATYHAKTTACQATCSNPRGASECPLPDTENCVCDEGYVLEGDACIEPEECGCVDDQYLTHKVGLHVSIQRHATLQPYSTPQHSTP